MQLQRLAYDRARGWSEPFAGLDSPETLVLTFAAPGFRDAPGPIEELQAAFPRSHHLGCSTAGEIHGDAVRDDSLAVAVARFERSTLASAVATATEPDESYAAGRDLAEQLAQRDDLQGIFVLSDGLTVNGSQLVRAIGDVVDERVVVTGGMAGDGDRFGATWCLLDGRPTPGVVRAVGFYGDRVRVGYGCEGGWDRFGPQRCITRSDGNVLYELDGRPALQLYRQYLGDRAGGLPATGLLFPLALRADGRGDRVVRTILAVDEAEQSMTFAGDVPEGARVQLMRANVERLIGGAEQAACSTGDDDDQEATLSIAISCVGRRLVLGERTEEEIEAALSSLPRDTVQVGFYSYGEFSPHGLDACELHNQTMTLTTLSERPAVG